MIAVDNLNVNELFLRIFNIHPHECNVRKR